MKTTQRILIGWTAVAMSISAGFAHAGLPDSMAVAILGSAAIGQQGSSGSIFSGFSSGHAATPNDPFVARGVANAPAANAPAANAPAADAGGVTRLPPTNTAPTSAPQPDSDDRYANVPPAAGQPGGSGGNMPRAYNPIGSGGAGQVTVGGNTFTAPSYNPNGNNAIAVSGLQAAGANPPAQVGPMQPGNRAHSDAMLKQARLALAVGDVRHAGDLLAQARQDQIRYASSEDSPERVDAAIKKFVEVNRLDRALEENRRAYARMWMEQCEALLQWGELDQAEKLASLASDQHVTYGPYDTKPAELLRRIAAMRMQSNPAGPMPQVTNNAAPGAVGASQAARQQAQNLMRQIRIALNAGQVSQAEFMCRQLDSMRIREDAFAPGEDSPGKVFAAVHTAQRNFASSVIQAGGSVNMSQGVQSAVYDPSRDPTHNMQVAAAEKAVEQASDTIPAPATQPGAVPSTAATASPGADGQSPGYGLFQQAQAALKAHDRDRALKLLQQASAYSNELDQPTAARLQDQLSLLSGSKAASPHAGPAGQVDEAAAAKNAMLNQVYADVNHRESDARAMREKDPKMALTMLEETRKRVEAAGIDPTNRDQLLRRLDRAIAEMQQYITQNHSKIELKEKNEHVIDEINRARLTKEQVQQKLAELVDQFNKLCEEQRYEEAEVIAKRARELAPHEMVTQVMVPKIRIQRSLAEETRIKEAKDAGYMGAMNEVDASSIPFAGDPVVYPDAKTWKGLTGKRLEAALKRSHHNRSAQEMEIEKKLETPVNYSCHNRPLVEVLNQLAKLTSINIHIDEEGLKEEGLSPDMPVTLELNSDIQLKSYLSLLLEKHHLCYLVKHEVLNVTSESKKADGSQIYQQVYPVGDLVIPIPNFVASPRMGLAGALHDAMSNAVGTSGGGMGSISTPMPVVANSRQGNVPSNMMANLAGVAPRNATAAGPGGAGGGVNPDFDTLMDLITQTVAPPTWDHNGGKGTVAASPTNLSLVISQTQEVHEEIVDLLEQLRRMQDLQITIEVRFITLSDDFFERIGVDFDFTVAKNIANPTNAGFSPPQNISIGGQNFVAPTFNPNNNNGIAVSGLQAAGTNPAKTGLFTADNSIQYTQGSYALAVPQFGGFDATAGATVGFAILNDIEAFFFINAAAGDKRTNLLQAPKVTLFNGQQAFVSDTSQTPFVISVIPVVGDFAAAQQPVIVVLSEGTFMTVQAVVSNDRRFVRLTVVPFFSKIGNVQTFTFQGTSTTTQSTTRNGIVNQVTNQFNNNNDQATTTNSGVTVQLPTFSFVTVTTTVSVPDGGTVLLGGIKRLSEGRNEFGVPILDEIPYVNRLFKNVGIGRETSSLMMMVTPRIIIQEEEEDKLGIGTGT